VFEEFRDGYEIEQFASMSIEESKSIPEISADGFPAFQGFGVRPQRGVHDGGSFRQDGTAVIRIDRIDIKVWLAGYKVDQRSIGHAAPATVNEGRTGEIEGLRRAIVNDEYAAFAQHR